MVNSSSCLSGSWLFVCPGVKAVVAILSAVVDLGVVTVTVRVHPQAGNLSCGLSCDRLREANTSKQWISAFHTASLWAIEVAVSAN